MKIQINTISFNVIDKNKVKNDENFDYYFSADNEKDVENIIHSVFTSDYSKTAVVNIVSSNIDLVFEILRSIKIIEAAGGVVSKNDSILFIHRIGKWDLPKGKIEIGESIEKAAVREVEEECGVVVKLESKLCDTYHTYKMKNQLILKKTYWFEMICVNDSEISPQIEEGIDLVEFIPKNNINVQLENTYENIKVVLTAFLNKR